MAKSLDDVLSAFTPEQRARVEAHVQELIEEELTLRAMAALFCAAVTVWTAGVAHR